MEQHSSSETDLKDVHKRLQPYAFTPDGPADPEVRRAAAWITDPSSASNIIGRESKEGSQTVASNHS